MTTLTLSPVDRRALPRGALRIRPSLSPHWDSRSLPPSQLPSRSRYRTSLTSARSTAP